MKKDSHKNFKTLQHKKMIGYLFRFASIIAFGLFSIVGKYLLDEINTLERIGISSLIISLFLVLPILFYKFILSSQNFTEEIISKLNKPFLFLMFVSLFFQIFYFLSTDYIPASHTALYLTLAPIIALLLNYLFVPSFKAGIFKNKFLSISLFMLATIGSLLVFMGKGDSIRFHGFLGELFAIFLIMVDILYAIALIGYFKMKKRFTPFESSMYLMLFSGLFLSPIIVYHVLQNGFELIFQNFWELVLMSIILLFMYYFIMESYMRCNGLINYLLMSFFPISVISLEFLFFNFKINTLFLLGAGLIILSALLIEIINTKMEKN